MYIKPVNREVEDIVTCYAVENINENNVCRLDVCLLYIFFHIVMLIYMLKENKTYKG